MSTNMGAGLKLRDAEKILESLIKQYQDMEKCVKRFESVSEEYRGLLEDTIMATSDEALTRIRENMRSINKYITEYTGQKLAAVTNIERIEMKGGKKVGEIK